MPAPPNSNFRCSCLAVVGVGLIGGSIARAARQRRLADRLLGFGRNQPRLVAAVSSGVIDAGSTDWDLLTQADFVVVCTPVDQIADDVKRIVTMNPNATITDAGSVKGSICRQLGADGEHDRFLGAHPLAGSEKQGFEHANPDLFVGRVCVTTPTDGTDFGIQERVEAFWRELGMSIQRMSPERHDRLLALSSHLPHLAAAAIAAQLTPEAADFASTGFRDTTRVASGDPHLWTSILLENRIEVSRATHDLVALLNEFQAALDSNNSEILLALLSQAHQTREHFLTRFLSHQEHQAQAE